MKRAPATPASYIAARPAAVRKRLLLVRREVRAVVHSAEESVAYGILSYGEKGRPFLYSAAWKDAVALYPVPPGTDSFNAAVAKYRKTKSAVHFPHDAPMPAALLRRIIRVCRRRAARRNAVKRTIQR